jgi:hypothetical protein
MEIRSSRSTARRIIELLVVFVITLASAEAPAGE